MRLAVDPIHYIPNPKPEPCTLQVRLDYALSRESRTPYTLHPKPYTLNPKHQILNPKPGAPRLCLVARVSERKGRQALHPGQDAGTYLLQLNPKPSTLKGADAYLSQLWAGQFGTLVLN
jgi:hypothetical protein